MMSVLRFLAGLAALAAVAAFAQPLPAGVQKVTTVEGITEYRLDNGLKVLLFPDPSKPTVVVNITYLVGSKHENYGETGMAHLLEHLLFKGTPRNPDIDKQFNARGARSNGTTSTDRTNYFELFQASEDNLRWAIELEADRMVNSYIAKKDLDSEMTVVRNEYENGENSPVGVLFKRLEGAAFDAHAYGRSPIGVRSDIENVRIENLQAFYRTYYQPDNAVLLVAGKFDEAKALAIVARAFGPIPRPTRVLPPSWTVEPTQDGEREVRVRRKGDLQVVAVAYHVPSNLSDDSDAVAFSSFILADTPSGRLHKALVQTGKAAQVASVSRTGLDPGLQVFAAIVKKGDPMEPVRDEMIRILESFGATPPTKEEVARARQSYENAIEKTLANPEAFGVQLSEYIALGDWRLFFLARDDLAKTTPEAIAKAASAYFRRDNRTVGYFLPEDAPLRAEIPAAPPVAQVMKDFKANGQAAQAEAFEPTQANLDARTKRLTIAGTKVALLAKKNRGETVNVSVALRVGNEQALFGQQVPAQFAGAMLSRGTTKFTREQLADEFTRLKVSGRVSGPGGSFQTTRPNLEAALRLAVHVLKEPSFPPAEFEELRKLSVTSIQAQFAEPSARASEALSQHFNTYPKGDWRHAPTLEESLAAIQAVKLEDVKRFHRDFYGANPAELAIVGDFDEAKVIVVLRELLEGWTPRTPYTRVDTEYRAVAPASFTIETPDKENATWLAARNIELRDDDPDFPGAYVANYILGGGAGLDSRLGSRIRQKDGLSYSVGSELSAGVFTRAGSWSAYAIAAPQNVAKVEAAFREEIARALRDGFTEAEVAAAKSGILQMRAQNRAQDGTVAGAWVGLLEMGRTWAFSQALEERLQSLTVAEVNAALRKYVDPAQLTFVKAGDFKGKAAK